ncbi:Integrin beta-1 [Dermatophagoides pteronyssinus]|uniref:Integrin beta n=1 Tax=Dermatophagoides pteronyssinus TaxID=6956 RepID=A0ABQ8IXY3_DERPT|nr:Integrin beta-1 [Dermatophagoides pteronyssinus]
MVNVQAQSNNNNCSIARTCSECISISYQCRWCSGNIPDNFESNSNIGRCSSWFDPEKCPKKYQENPQEIPTVDVLENRPFSDSMEQTIQLRPQKIRINSRIGTVVTIKMEFKQAEDYPMDLYYLMDISCTMLKHKTSVSRVGRKLATKIQSTTKDFRIGFGSYVDKETIPFSNYKFNSKINCNKQPMVNTYSFYNHMPLNSNTSEFEYKVQSAKISGNLDSPEGTLDALMQVMVCPEEIGWREHSDKIIVVATDEEFHYAGDGKLGGILLPNDGRCHLSNSRYIGSTIYDYPSMHHISEIAQQKKFNLVFTVSDLVAQKYQVLSNIIGVNSRVASLKVNDDTIAELIDEVYRNISNQIELNIEEKPDNVDVEIWTNCGVSNDPLRHTSTCRFFGKATIEFDIKIRLTSCKQNDNENIIKIGLLNKDETIEIYLNSTCQCECELYDAELDSPKCSNNGTFSCGICTKCNGIRSGKQCECDPDKPIDPRKPDAHCRPDSNSRPCNGHGHCICGRCQCDGMFAGQFCQEDQSACYKNGLKCGGHGQCQQSRCNCDDGYQGSFCDCPISNNTCITNIKTGELCNGRGDCHCGRCKCSLPTSMGRLCQHCAQCNHQKYCQLLRQCVPDYQEKFCQTYFDIDKNQTIKQECDRKICVSNQWSYQLQQDIDQQQQQQQQNNNNDDPSLPNWFETNHELTWYQAQCSQIINGCVIAFDYRLMKPIENDQSMNLIDLEDVRISTNSNNNNQLPLNFILKNITESCPIRINATQVAIGSFATVIIAGIIGIIIMKCITNYLDYREYERFKNEIAKADFALQQNPLYKDVNTQFRNPVFGGIRDRTSKLFFFNKK